MALSPRLAWIAAAAALLAALAAWLLIARGDEAVPPEPLPALAGRVLPAGCRQGECVWSRIVSIERLRSVPQGELRRVALRRGRSLHPDDPPDAFAPDLPVEWEAADESHYVFCSTERPAYAFPDRGAEGLIVHFLDPFRIAGYEYGSARAYMRFCHDEAFAEGDGQGLHRLGYRPGTRSEQVERASPEDLARF